VNEYDEIRNRVEPGAEAKFPGYVGPNWGVWTPGAAGCEKIKGLAPIRTPFADDERSYLTQLASVSKICGEERVYWVDAPRAKADSTIESAVLVGDEIEIAEVPGWLRVTQVCVMVSESKIAVPYRKGTLLSFRKLADRRE